MKYIKLMRVLFPLAIIMVLTAGCAGWAPDTLFSTVIKPAGLAREMITVVSGNGTSQEILLTDSLIQGLKTGGYQVLDRDQISRLIPIYPCSIIQNDFSDETALDSPWLSEENLRRMDTVRQKLGVNLILLTWVAGVQTSTSQGLTKCSTLVATRLISYPDRQVVAYTCYMHTTTGKLIEKISDTQSRMWQEVSTALVNQILAELKD